MCLFEKPHPIPVESPPLLVTAQAFQVGKGKSKTNQPTEKKKKASLGGLRLCDKLEIDPHPVICGYDTQEKK